MAEAELFKEGDGSVAFDEGVEDDLEEGLLAAVLEGVFDEGPADALLAEGLADAEAAEFSDVVADDSDGDHAEEGGVVLFFVGDPEPCVVVVDVVAFEVLEVAGG